MGARIGVMVLLVALGGASRVDAAGVKEEVARANALFKAERYPEAADAFQAAYRLKPHAMLLFNAAQALRKATRFPEAVALYRRFLAEAVPAERAVEPEARAWVKDLEEQIANEGRARAHSAPPVVEPRPAVVIAPAAPPPGPAPEFAPVAATELPATVEPRPASAAEPRPAPAVEPARPAPAIESAAAEPARADLTQSAPPKPLHKRWYVWAPVAVGVVAIALGVGLGVGLNQPPSTTLGSRTPSF